MNRNQVSQMFQTVRLNQRTPTVLTLRDGQFVMGRVERFYPGNKASIRINGHQIVAEVDSPIVANKNYLLQVKSSHPSIHLQLVNEQAVKNHHDVAEKILREFNLRGTKNEIQLLSQFIKGQVPIKKDQVIPLVNLIKNNGAIDVNVLKEMLHRQLPLSQSVYESIYQRMNQPLSYSNIVNQVQQSLLTELNSNEKIQLNNYLNLFSNNSVSNQSIIQSFIFQTLYEIGRNDTTTFDFFKQAGLIPKNIEFQSWANQWRSWASANSVPIMQMTEDINLPFNIKAGDITNAILNLNKNQFALTRQDLQTLINGVNQLKLIQMGESSTLNKINLNEGHWNALNSITSNRTFLNQLMSAIERGQLNDVRQLLNTESGKQFLSELTQTINAQVITAHKKVFSFWQMLTINNENTLQTELIPTRFNGFLQLTQHENITHKLESYPSLLSLLHSVNHQTQNSTLNESINQLQQIFQAIHLSFSETNRDWTQFLIHFPKELFHLNEDMWMEFEGKRNENGKLDSSTARILFYLNLPNMHKTVIDMYVQNRQIHLTIYNENVQQMKLLSAPIISQLEMMLEQQNYELEHLHFLPYKNVESHEANKVERREYNLSYNEGIDLKI